MAYLLDLTEKQIAEAERMFPCSACTILQPGAYRYRRSIQLEATR
jgi:hypothetical protein